MVAPLERGGQNRLIDELGRAAIGVPVALLWPLGLPIARAAIAWRPAASAATVALVLAPVLPGVAEIVLIGLVAAAAALLEWRWPPSASPNTTADPATREVVVPIALAAVLATMAVVLLGAADAWDALRGAVADDDVVYVALGGVTAVFASGAIVGRILRPLAGRPEVEGIPGMARAGLAIGWLERALVFTFVVAGEPAAAALALTAKSVARFPVFADGGEPLAEYVLIGTLTSFVLATLAAVATRGLLGLPAL